MRGAVCGGMAVIVLLGCAGDSHLRAIPAAVAAPIAETSAPFVCPEGGHTIAPGTPLQPLVDAAAPGTVFCLAPGVHHGPLEIRTPIVLQGPAGAVIRSSGQGTTIRVLAARAELEGFTIDGSGDRPDTMDAAVYVHGERVAVRRLTIRRALFGLVADQSFGVTFEGNRIEGDPARPEGLRGDGIRLWEVRGASILNNRLEDSRDLAVWYSPGNLIAGNTVARSRYALHFMYSSDCVVRGNTFHDNIVGVFVMYSRNIAISDNLITEHDAPDSMGLGVKESGDVIIRRNRFLNDRQCLYLDGSPFRDGDVVVVADNTFARCSVGVTFHKSETRTTFEDNRFEANETPAVVEGHGTAQGVLWRRNYFDDYRGYDLDGDGFGDVPYELRDLSERLVSRHPDLAFLRGSAAFALIDLTAEMFPVLQPQTLLVDRTPRVIGSLGHRGIESSGHRVIGSSGDSREN